MDILKPQLDFVCLLTWPRWRARWRDAGPSDSERITEARLSKLNEHKKLSVFVLSLVPYTTDQMLRLRRAR